MKSPGERLHKILAQHGIGSRRDVERWIGEGRLQLNNRVASIGDRYHDGDRVQLDGRDITRRLAIETRPKVLAYHKPQGQPIEQRSHAPVEGEAIDADGETVMERLPQLRGVRWVAINPMHPGDSGLLLFTNDGALSYALTRHKKKIPATYMVRVHVRGGATAAPVIGTTLKLDNETIEFSEVAVSTSAVDADSEAGNVWYQVKLERADKRAAVRALFVSHGLTISRMTQVAFGDIELTKDMPRGRHQELKPVQVASLYTLADLAVPKKETPQRGHEPSADAPRRRESHARLRHGQGDRTATGSKADTRVDRPARSKRATSASLQREAPRSRNNKPGDKTPAARPVGTRATTRSNGRARPGKTRKP